jgi:hypothetical protein
MMTSGMVMILGLKILRRIRTFMTMCMAGTVSVSVSVVLVLVHMAMCRASKRSEDVYIMLHEIRDEKLSRRL